MKRMSISQSLFAFFLPLALSVATVASAQVGTQSSAAPVSLSATLPASVTVSATPNSFTWSALTPGGTTNAGSTVTIATAWVLSAGTSLELDAFFSNPAQAMNDGSSHYIPASAIFASISGGDTIASTALTGSTTIGGAGSGLTVFSISLSGNMNSSRSDTMALSIHLNGLTIPAGTYTGSLTIQAQVL